MNKRILLLLFSFCSIFSAVAQEQPDSTDTSGNVADTSDYVNKNILSDTLLEVNDIPLQPDSIAAIRNTQPFTYTKNLDSLLRELKKKSGNNTVKMPTKSNSWLDAIFGSGIFSIILWGLAIFFVGYILYSLFLSKGIFTRKSYSKNVSEAQDETEAFEAADYDALIRQAYKLQDYRMGIRYLFLKSLQRLNQKTLIAFAADKTNSQYLKEVPQDKRNAFAKLILNYEYAWYGHTQISKEMFDGIETIFSAFINKV